MNEMVEGGNSEKQVVDVNNIGRKKKKQLLVCPLNVL